MRKQLSATLAILACGLWAPATADTISLTAIGTPYTQDFNTLASTGTSDVLPTGWVIAETLTAANSTYTASDGQSTTGDTYSFGTTGSSDRALGGIRTSVLLPLFGAGFTNDTGATITSLAISYTGEQWRLGYPSRTDKISFQYSITASGITSGSFTAVSNLEFAPLTKSGTPRALDGNAQSNRAVKSWTITGVSIPNGSTFYVRWIDFDATDADDGLAVDDFSLTPFGTPGTEIPARFGPGALLATQTRPTNYGDNLNELDRIYGKADDGNLRLGITGNLQANGNGIIILLDTKAGGNNPFSYTTWNGDGGSLTASQRIYGLNGDTLDSGFNPDYAIDTNNTSGAMYADLYDLQANGNAGSKLYLGSVTEGATATTLSVGGVMAFFNSNTAGVTDSNPTAAATATSGLEISLPLSQIGSPSGAIKVMVLLTDPSGNVSNQVLPGLPDTYGGLPKNAADFASYPGRQYVEMTPVFTASDLSTTETPWAFGDRVFSGDGSLDSHPPVVSAPTVYNGRAYVVEDVEHAGGTHTGYLVAVKTDDGTLDTSFGTAGRITLDAPATGRVTIRGVGGVVRLYVVDNTGKIYSMDTDGAALRTAKPRTGVTKATGVAVIEDSGVPVAYYGVLTSSGAFLVKVIDATTMDSTTLELVGATDLTSSPSVIRGGGAVQIGTVNGSSGKVYSVLSSLLPIYIASTANPVKASPTLSSDSSLFYVGDAPSSGDGSFYCFNASNGQQVASVPISGGLEYAAFGDYSIGNTTNAMYFATSTGQLNAVNPATLNSLSGYPATPMGALTPTGSVTVLNGRIYVPTSNGMYAVPSSAPTTCARFQTSSEVSTVSTGSRAAGSTMVTTGKTGDLYGLKLQ